MSTGAATSNLLDGRFKLLNRIGQGGMGEVFRAQDLNLGREVAVKVLKRNLSDETSRLRFKREAEVVSSLSSPGIARLLESGIIEDSPYLVFELVDGETLERRIVRGRLEPVEALEITSGIADALEVAHCCRVVHRDLKPQNVILTKNGPRLLDFGVAALLQEGDGNALTSPGTRLGSPSYMSPDYLMFGTVQPTNDIWALGVILVECLIGKWLFQKGGINETVKAVLEWRVSDLDRYLVDFPIELRQLVSLCMDRDPSRRLSSAKEISRYCDLLLGKLLCATEATIVETKSTEIQSRGHSADATSSQLVPYVKMTLPRASGCNGSPEPRLASARDAHKVLPEESASDAGFGSASNRLSPNPVGGSSNKARHYMLFGFILLSLAALIETRAVDSVETIVNESQHSSIDLGSGQVAQELSSALLEARSNLSGAWLKNFAESNRTKLLRARKDSIVAVELSRELATHLEAAGVSKYIEAFLQHGPRYFREATIAETEKWLLSSRLCALELIQLFCEEHSIPWPISVKVEELLGAWNGQVNPMTMDLLGSKTWVKHRESRERGYFPGGSIRDEWVLPKIGKKDRVLVWFLLTHAQPRIVLDVMIGERFRKVLTSTRSQNPSTMASISYVDVVVNGKSTGPSVYVPTGMDRSRNTYLGFWVPPLLLASTLSVKVEMVELPLGSGMKDPILWDRCISIVSQR